MEIKNNKKRKEPNTDNSLNSTIGQHETHEEPTYKRSKNTDENPDLEPIPQNNKSKHIKFSKLYIDNIPCKKKSETTITLRLSFLNNLFLISKRDSILAYLHIRHGEDIFKTCNKYLRIYDSNNQKTDLEKEKAENAKLRLTNHIKSVISDPFNCIDLILTGIYTTRTEIDSALINYPELIISLGIDAVTCSYSDHVSSELFAAILEYLDNKKITTFISLFDDDCQFNNIVRNVFLDIIKEKQADTNLISKLTHL